MLLIFYGTGTDSHVGEQIVDVVPVFRVKHFICSGQTGFFNGTQMQTADCDESGNHIRFCLRIRLGSNSFIAFSGGPWLVRVDTWNQNQLVFRLLVYSCQAVDIIHNRLFFVCGAWSDDDKKFI